MFFLTDNSQRERETKEKICMKKIAALIIVAFLGAFALAPGEARATLSFDLTYIVSGSAVPVDGSHWLSATFANAGANQVSLTLTSNLMNSNYYWQQVGINVDPTVVPSSLGFTVGTKVGSFTNPTISRGNQNAQDIPGGGDSGKGFDILFSFSTSNAGGGIARFNGSDSVSYTITGSGITKDSFSFMNSAPNNVVAANIGAHLALGGANSEFAASVVPLPAAVWLLGSGLIGVAVIRRKRKI
jgi:hypothetical protein